MSAGGKRAVGGDRRPEQWLRNAHAAYESGRGAEARRLARRVVDQIPDQPDALHLLALISRDEGRREAAAEMLRRVVARQPANAVALNNLANLLREMNDTKAAIGYYERALNADPAYVSALFNLGAALADELRVDDAIACLRRCAAVAPRDPSVWCRLSALLLDAERVDEALEAAHRARSIAPDDPESLDTVARVHLDRGEFDAAADCLTRALERDPGYIPALVTLAKTRRFETLDDPAARRIVSALTTNGLSDGERADVLFAAAKIFDDVAGYDKAFEYLKVANALRFQYCKDAVGDPEADADRIIGTFDASFFTERRGWGRAEELPILIVGMPRSGTTLIEQMVAAHPDVHAAGELMDLDRLARGLGARIGSPRTFPECVPDMDREIGLEVARDYLAALRARGGTAARVTDKLPGNYFYLGLVAAVLPGARYVLCRRHPLDLGISNYFADFTRGHAWSYDLAAIGRQYRSFAKIMAHWKQVTPGGIHEVDYESLVAEPELTLRALLEYCGLPWNPACLNFHRVDRAVHTASAWQVRQPVYRRSVGRWRNYERYLGPLRAALGDVLGDADRGGRLESND